MEYILSFKNFNNQNVKNIYGKYKVIIEFRKNE
jgi:hypothetical protein